MSRTEDMVRVEHSASSLSIKIDQLVPDVISRLGKECDIYKSDIEIQKKTIAELEQRVSNLSRELEGLNIESREYKAREAENSNKISSLAKDLATYREKLAEKEETLKEKESDLEYNIAKVNYLAKEREQYKAEQLDILKQDDIKMEALTSKLQSFVSKFNQTRNRLEVEINAKKLLLAELHSLKTIKNKSQTQETPQVANEAHVAKLHALEKEQAKLVQGAADSFLKVQELNNLLTDHKSKLSAASAKESAVKQEIEQIRKQFLKLTSDIDDLQRVNTELNSSLAASKLEAWRAKQSIKKIRQAPIKTYFTGILRSFF